MRKLLIATLALAVLAFPAAAGAGGWATAGVEPPSGGVAAGDTWNAKITILQHGVTPLAGVEPMLTIRNESGKQLKFPARPTGETGVYEAQVRFPSNGTWSYAVYDGFERYGGAQTHTFGPIEVGPSPGGGVSLWPFVLGGVVAVALAASAAFAVRLRRRTSPAPAL